MNRHRDLSFAASFPEVGKWPIHVQVSHYASVACRRLDRIGSAGKKQAKKPTDDEVNQSRVSQSLSLLVCYNLRNFIRLFFGYQGPNLPQQHVWKYTRRGDGLTKRQISAQTTTVDSGHTI